LMATRPPGTSFGSARYTLEKVPSPRRSPSLSKFYESISVVIYG
jgi:hypothetical protein